MSQYIIEHPDYKVVVGWDNPLETFYCQVIEVSDDDEDEEGWEDDCIRLWKGAAPGERLTFEEMRAALSKYAEIPEDIAAQLLADYEARTPPTALQSLTQRLMLEMMQEIERKREGGVQ